MSRTCGFPEWSLRGWFVRRATAQDFLHSTRRPCARFPGWSRSSAMAISLRLLPGARSRRLPPATRSPRPRIGAMMRSSFPTWPVCTRSCRSCARKPSSWAALVKLQWMRDDEFAWAPFGPAMAMKVEAALGADGRIVDWSYDVWSNSHAMRPGQPGGVNLLAAWDLKTPFVKSPAPHIPQPFGAADRNAVPSYELPRKEIRNHLLLDAPVRNGSFRTLGSHGNIFAIESFMDELAEAAGSDPLAFRLAHLRDPRAQSVLQAVADKAGWAAGKKGDGQRGRGLAFCRYKSIGMYAAAVVDVEVDRKTGVIRVSRVVMAADLGLVVNPDGAKNQLEGGIVQAVSLALKEQVAFDRRHISSRDWSAYPILTFSEVPSIEIVLMQRSDPSLGAGEGSLSPNPAGPAHGLAPSNCPR